MTRLTFLGTGGGRFATMTQARATGGLYIEDGPNKVHIDPGPGALVRMHECGLDPARTSALLISHAHLDHCNDAAVLMEGMTRGGLEPRGEVLASRSVLVGHEGLGPILSPHHQRLVPRIEMAEPNRSYKVAGMRVDTGPTDHTDPTNVSFRVWTGDGDVAYFTDSAYKGEYMDPLKGVRVLVLGITRPKGSRISNHLASEDAVDAVAVVNPEMLVLTHLGLKVLREGPEKEAAWIEAESGVRTVAATDRMQVLMRDELTLGMAAGSRRRRRRRGPRKPSEGAPPGDSSGHGGKES